MFSIAIYVECFLYGKSSNFYCLIEVWSREYFSLCKQLCDCTANILRLPKTVLLEYFFDFYWFGVLLSTTRTKILWSVTEYGNSKSIKYVNTTIVDYIHTCLICFGVRVICSPSWRQVLAITRVKTNILYFILDAKKVVLTLLSGRAKVPPNLVLN